MDEDFLEQEISVRFNPAVCIVCGCYVHLEFKEKHSHFHDNLHELGYPSNILYEEN